MRWFGFDPQDGQKQFVATAKTKYYEVAFLKYQLSDQDVAEINRILNERGNQSVRIKIENGKVTVFLVSEKLVIKK